MTPLRPPAFAEASAGKSSYAGQARGNPATEDWIDEARKASLWSLIERWPHRLKRSGNELVGPCPACGGRDRFAINRAKNVWFCRKSGRGGDAIALVQYLDGADFLGAVEVVTGRPNPGGEGGIKQDPQLIEKRQRDSAARAAQRAREQVDYRDREITRAHDIWMAAAPIAGSMAERYLRFRGVQPPLGAKLRCHNSLPYWHCLGTERGRQDWKVIHEGPAMVAAIQGGDGRFQGAHCTWIDPGFALRASPGKPHITGSGKMEIFHPETGEQLASKKVRGSAKAGHIHLSGDQYCNTLIVGEGIETVLSVRESGNTSTSFMYWSSISLGNLGGKARESVLHPTLTRKDSKGRIKRMKVPGPIPDLADMDVLMPPGHINEIIILGDGDSDHFTTDCVLRRAATRWAKPGRQIRAAWADAGSDFNSMLLAAPAPQGERGAA